MRRLLAIALALAAALAVAGPAAADGDPASDFLLTQKTFLPFDAKISKADMGRLNAIVAAATKAGYPIRVAVIATDYDLGSVQALWRKPQTYARFLGVELSFVYKGRLLVVMPNGFGFNHPKHATAAERKLLAGIPIEPGGAGLAAAATTAVQRLAAAAGVEVRPPAAAAPAEPSDSTRRDRLEIVVGIVVLLALGLAARTLLRRRRRRPA